MVKVVPLEGSVEYNKERQKLAHEVIAEVIISLTVSSFNAAPKPSRRSPNATAPTPPAKDRLDPVERHLSPRLGCLGLDDVGKENLYPTLAHGQSMNSNRVEVG